MGSIQVERVTRRFGTTVAVDDISLSIDDGDFLVLLGPSGCGKSTLLRMLAGLLPTSEGRFIVDGVDVSAEHARDRDLAMVFQSYALYPHLSVRSNLAFPLRARRRHTAEIRDRVAEVARILEIDHLLDRKPKELSGGQRQRVAVGRALVRHPKAFLMDEPLSNLDAKLRTATRHELVTLHQQLGATFVYVTHDQVEAMTMATKIAVLNGGRLEQVGAPLDVYARPASTFVAGFLGSPPMNLLDVRITSEAGHVAILGDGFDGVLWPGETADIDAVLGIRPEHLELDGRGAVQLDLTVDNIENLGHETLIFASLDTQKIVLRASPDTAIQTGDALRAGAPIEHLHLFDRASGRRLDWVPQSNSPHPHAISAPV
ncbi:sn-glycerol-3-phosphate ABC transporter ATP-binding protein UgpC [Salinibacterium sp. ZJ77]|uniref:ABC transporter ATP-binding protein n=1 Tax=Salinibacterium sp. ZJ77 TaxID=2708337 RepID=UPI001422C022|nr:sn-glycerol-3-phosphate ABC transporter ATP-binding protein UgpC [Salinibacterium sp. ZJ77]